MTRTNAGLFILAAVLLVLPLLLPNTYYVDIANRMAINAIVVLALNLLIGFAGQISLGHAGFFGIGAYASAVLTTHFSWPPIAALCAGAAGAAGAAGTHAPNSRAAIGLGDSQQDPVAADLCLHVLDSHVH